MGWKFKSNHILLTVELYLHTLKMIYTEKLKYVWFDFPLNILNEFFFLNATAKSDFILFIAKI